jgi:hypothetical protein
MPWIRAGAVTAADRAVSYPCDDILDGQRREFYRAVDVEASPAVMFRWLCQVKVAPYSYDLVDNLGRRSPSEITPGLADVKVGQPFMIGSIVAFEPDRHITMRSTPKLDRFYGPISMTYAIHPRGERACRVVVKGVLGARSWLGRVRAEFVVLGDAPMMRKQLLTLKKLAERDERRLDAPSLARD